MLREVKQFLKNFGSCEKIMEYLSNLVQTWKKLKIGEPFNDKMERLLIEIKAFKTNIGTFIQQLQAQYLLYRDLLQPFLAGIAMVRTLYIVKE